MLKQNGMEGLADDLMKSIGIQDLRSAIAPMVKQAKLYDLLQVKGAIGSGIARGIARGGITGPLMDVITPLLNASALGGTAKWTGRIAQVMQGVTQLGPNAAKSLAKILPTMDSKTQLQILEQLAARGAATLTK